MRSGQLKVASRPALASGSAPAPGGGPALRSALMLGGALLLALALAAAAPTTAATPQATRAQLRSLRSRIAAMGREDSRDAAERDRLSAQLRSAELSLSDARAALQSTDQQLAGEDAQRAALMAARAQQARALVAVRSGLEQELRAAYLLRRGGALQLLLNQKDPLASQRLVTYYGYFSRAGAARVTAIEGQLQRLGALDAALAQQRGTLAALRELQQGQLQQLSQAQASRQAVLASLTLRVHTRAQQLAQLESSRATLERLLQTLERASRTAPAPVTLQGAFADLRGRLAWPVSGHVLAQFGQQRAGGVPSDGVLIGTVRDTPVHAVSAGRVVYADWLPGLGLLVIIDHGEGYLSLYAHNDRLYKAVGAPVAAGEVIAAAGDTGGRAEPQLLFEIRRAGTPINPLPWFRTPRPSAP